MLTSEWFKAWGLRSVRWTVACMVLLGTGMAFLSGNDPLVGADGYGSIAYFVTSTLPITQFPLLLLGVLLGSGEFSSRSAGSTFVAVPDRTLVLVAKTAVTTAIAAVTAVTALGLSAAATLVSGIGPALSVTLTAETTRMWVGSALYLVAATVFCFGLGMLLRRSTAAILVAFIIYVLDFALLAAPDGVGMVADLLPGHTGQVVTATDEQIALMQEVGSLAADPWTSLAVAATWAVAMTLVAGLRLRRHDI
ncbi:hypothetical protein [Georgenia halophila]|uniref:hypothetical protein n=1 Tax=Georgenia halophila TaxID=620889 RepID=UPI0031EBA2BF